MHYSVVHTIGFRKVGLDVLAGLLTVDLSSGIGANQSYCGGSGHGFKHGPALGEMVARLVLKDDTAEAVYRTGTLRRKRA
jgi:hypothetical protein